MKLLADSPELVDVVQLIEDGVQGDYIYMYPPRQSYYAIQTDRLERLIRGSLSETMHQPVNIYLHFPFCRQICAFCNLYSVTARPGEQFGAYVDLLEREIDQWSQLIAHRKVDTIYIGGGTPSIFPVSELERCLEKLENSLGTPRSMVAEVALEVAPDTVDDIKLRDLSSIGITRVNLGLQTTSDEGLHQIGRRHGFSLARERIMSALGAGFGNVCVDLIYGLPGQTVNQWQAIVGEVAMMGIPTICAYPLTLRPNTGFSRKHITLVGAEQYQKYDSAREILTQAGYAQETHVRYVVPGQGGYLQKQNHWAGQDVIGIGAGARGYLRDCDYRNGYSIRRRRDALEAYRSHVLAGRWPFTAGFQLEREERMRRRVVLGLLGLDRIQFKEEFGVDAIQVFADPFARLEGLGLVEVMLDHIALTESGRKYRDLIVQLFFSPEVWKRIKEFDYME